MTRRDILNKNEKLHYLLKKIIYSNIQFILVNNKASRYFIHFKVIYPNKHFEIKTFHQYEN